MNLYLCPGHKTFRNWSKPMKWCAFFRHPEHSSASQFRMSRNNLLHLTHLAYVQKVPKLNTACNFTVHTLWNIILEWIRKQGRKILFKNVTLFQITLLGIVRPKLDNFMGKHLITLKFSPHFKPTNKKI